MKIIFISSSLEPGQDGAGDQIRMLAVKLIAIGYEVGIVALNDRHILIEYDSFQKIDNIAVPTLRIPSKLNAKRRFDIAAKWINKFNAEWISLHYVSFGFQKKGFSLKMITSLRKLSGDAKLNIMFWELWCGIDPFEYLTSGYKEILLGYLQKFHIKLMISTTKPDSIFTSTNYYRDHLKKIGVKSKVVPVIGNIKIGEFGIEDEWNQFLNKIGLKIICDRPQDFLILGFFGTFYVCPGLKELLDNAAIAAKKLDKQLVIITIGKGRKSKTENILNDIENASIYKTGILATEMINRIMGIINLGVVTSAAHLLTKSSSAVAWQERGIPILISQKDKTYNKFEMMSKGIFQIASNDDIIKLIDTTPFLKPQLPVNEVLNTYESLFLRC